MSAINFNELSSVELIDLMNSKTGQVDAMMAMCIGEGFEHFSCHHESTQHDYLSLVAELIQDIRMVNREINNRHNAGKEGRIHE